VSRFVLATVLISAATVGAQPRGGQPQPEFIVQGRQLEREGKLEEALAVYRKELQASPESPAANNAAGVVLDLMGKGGDARQYFAKAIDAAPSPQAKAQAQRSMAMSYAFEGDCGNTAKYEQLAIDYWATAKDFYQQGELADEAARVCIDAGDLDAAYQWYKKGRDFGLQEPGIKPDRKDLWEFRWEHAQARIAARRGNQAEARKHVAAAKAILDRGVIDQAQAQFFPYLTGYVALYRGEYKTALEDLQKANQNDPFIQCLIGQTYEKLGDKEKAMECYRKAAGTTAHNPPGAYARPFARKKL
jgi:tetratricopeptide (TPR) repeat protein